MLLETSTALIGGLLVILAMLVCYIALIAFDAPAANCPAPRRPPAREGAAKSAPPSI